MIDWWKGIKGASGPKLKKSGRPIPGTQLDTYDMLVRMLGFRPASEARQFEIGSGYEQRAKDKKGSEHDKMMGTWLNVTAPGDRARAWEKIRVWNQGRPGKERIKMSDLLRAKKRRAKEDRETVKLDQD
jgi:hypothetical protein